jgi:hypothetical protein
MKKTICKIGLVLALFLISTISEAALEDWDAKAREKYENARAEYLKITKTYESARQDWLKAKKEYKMYKHNLTNVLGKAIKHLTEADKRLVGYIKMICAYIEAKPGIQSTGKQALLKELSSFIEWLENKQVEIKQANTKSKLLDLARVVRDKWREIKQVTKRIAGEMMNFRIGWLIAQAEKAIIKIEKLLQRLEEEGKDVGALRVWLENLKAKIEQAKQKYGAAKQKYSQAKDLKDADELIREAKAFVLEAKRYLRTAYRNLREIVKELKKYRTGEVTLRGTGIVVAEGDGSAYISGNGTVNLSGNGTLVITDVYGDLSIEVSGFGNKTELQQNKWQYTGTGSADIAGSDIVVELEGRDIYLRAEGTGSITLKGTGSYTVYTRLECNTGNWTLSGAEIALSGG